MNRSHIFHLFVLNKYLLQLFGEHYPREIVRMIIMKNYGNLKIQCSVKNTCITDSNKCIWKNYNEDVPDNIKLFAHSIPNPVGTNYFIYLTDSDRLFVKEVDTQELFLPSEPVENIIATQELLLPSGSGKIIAIKCGIGHIMILTDMQTCYVWGANYHGQLGASQDVLGFYENPKRHYIENIIDVCCGTYHTIFVTANGDIYSTGNNNIGQLGFNSLGVSVPRKISMKFMTVSCCDAASTALTVNKELYAWGFCLELDRTIDKPLKVSDLSFESVCSGMCHFMALETNGNLYYGWFYDVHTLLKIDLKEPIKSINSEMINTYVVTLFDKIHIFEYEPRCLGFEQNELIL